MCRVVRSFSNKRDRQTAIGDLMERSTVSVGSGLFRCRSGSAPGRRLPEGGALILNGSHPPGGHDEILRQFFRVASASRVGRAIRTLWRRRVVSASRRDLDRQLVAASTTTKAPDQPLSLRDDMDAVRGHQPDGAPMGRSSIFQVRFGESAYPIFSEPK